MAKLNRVQKIGLAGIALAFLVSFYFAAAGVDYGPQWDQNLIKGHVNRYVRTGVLLPGEYIYPPVASYIATSTLIPYAAPFVARYGFNWTPTQDYLLNEVLKNPNESFLLNLRTVFVFFTVLAVLWAGLAAAQFDWRAGLVTAGALAFSWELVYHSRFIHPDGPTMQFTALALLFGLLAFYQRGPLRPQVWLGLAAAAAGVATATKYTAGLSIVVVLILAYGVAARQGWSWRRMLGAAFLLCAIFGATFVVLTPGLLLETAVFIQHVAYGQGVYASGHGLQTVNAGADYLLRVSNYVTQAAFSHYPVLAPVVAILAVLGVYSLVAKRQREGLVLAAALAGVPLVYILFLSTLRVLFVRNLLQVLPSLAILAGIGFVWAFDRLKAWRAGAQYALVGVVTLTFAFNAYWLWQTTASIQERRSDVFADQAVAAIEANPVEVYITPAAHQLLSSRALPANASLTFDGQDQVLFAYLGDTQDEMENYWPVNWAGIAPQVFGPHEINFDWHASWPGVERLVLARSDLAWQDASLYGLGVELDPDAATESVNGLLQVDGEQLIVEAGDRIVYLLNSANPKVIMALKPLLDSEIELTGRPHSAARPNDWFALAVNGRSVLAPEEAALEFHTIRYLANLTPAQTQCVAAAVGAAQFKAMADNMLPLIDLTPEELQTIIGCE